jgi:DNA gyrase subunit B
MKPLILNGRVFVAQPPLYLVTRKRDKKYVLDEREMRKSLADMTNGVKLGHTVMSS